MCCRYVPMCCCYVLARPSRRDVARGFKGRGYCDLAAPIRGAGARSARAQTATRRRPCIKQQAGSINTGGRRRCMCCGASTPQHKGTKHEARSLLQAASWLRSPHDCPPPPAGGPASSLLCLIHGSWLVLSLLLLRRFYAGRLWCWFAGHRVSTLPPLRLPCLCPPPPPPRCHSLSCVA
jgi:hypothetical protein